MVIIIGYVFSHRLVKLALKGKKNNDVVLAPRIRTQCLRNMSLDN